MDQRRWSNNQKPARGLGASPDKASELSRVKTASPPRTESNMLDVDSSVPRHGSIAGIGVGVTSPTQARKKNLDPSDPSTWTSSHSSPVEVRPRAASDVAEHPGLPKIQVELRDDFENTHKIEAPSIPTGPEPDKSVVAKDLAISSPKSPPAQKTTMDSPSSPSTHHLSPTSPKKRFPTSAGTAGDDETQRRLSNQSGSFSTVTSDGGEYVGRVMKDREGDEEAVEDSSDEKRSVSSFEDPDSPVAERGRQRKKTDKADNMDGKTEQVDSEDGNKSQQKSRSMLDVDVGATTHSGKFSETKSVVHPSSNFNRAVSPAPPSAAAGDDDDIQKAKALALRISPVDDKIVDRHVKMIIRGEWAKFQDHEVEKTEYRHEPRLYLACSDLSHEATYALEWTIGTLLKDGDTLLVINAVGDESASKQTDLEVEPSLEIRLESAKAAGEATEAMETLTKQTSHMAESAEPAPFKRTKELGKPASQSRSRDGRKTSKKEEDRLHAVEILQTDFLKFVRKTSLQVRCMIEVIHCRSPRHLIVNAIDELEPTLVVVGTRGQGTVRNVMMGSFSNYLVTKSSVPVMVARKRLKKARHAKVSSQQIRMTNNLTPFGASGKRKSLTQARID